MIGPLRVNTPLIFFHDGDTVKYLSCMLKDSTQRNQIDRQNTPELLQVYKILIYSTITKVHEYDLNALSSKYGSLIFNFINCSMI